MLEKIKERIENEKRPPQILYEELKALGVLMIANNALSEEAVTTFCADLIKLYQMLKKE